MKLHITPIIVPICSMWIMIASCNKLVDIPESKGQIESSIVFSDSTLATAALLDTYLTLGTTVHVGLNKNINLYADEYNYTSINTAISEFSQSKLSFNNPINTPLWNALFSVIYKSNSVIEGVAQSPNLSSTTKVQLIAEAKFIRAFTNFYLVNLYGHIPLILTTDVNANRRAFQVPPRLVYDQIITDLKEAKLQLAINYIGIGKVRANSWAASALLSRVYLYVESWKDAEIEASGLIRSGTYSPIPAVDDVFLATSKEAILQFWMVNGFVTDASQTVPASATALPNYVILEGLQNSFEGLDERKTKWIGTNNVRLNGTSIPYFFPYKYKNRTANTSRPEFLMALRLSEQYLIRSESLANQNDIANAVSDLNIIRIRAGVPILNSNISQLACLEAISKERRQEFFGEWGHRFFDLKRTKQLDVVIAALKPTWQPETSKDLPIPNTEIIFNSNLIQNNGY